MTDFGQLPTQGRQRPSSNRACMETSRTFEPAWREVKPRVERLLRGRGVTSDVVDDVTQETAIKLLRNWCRVDPGRPLWPLARTIALNCLVDEFRARGAEPVSELPDQPAEYDLEEHGIARARLASVTNIIGTLRPRDRSVLLAEIEGDERPDNSSASKMARLRARRRLASALERSAAAFGGVQLACRRGLLWLQQHGASGAEAAMPAVAGAAVALSVTFGSLGLSSPTESRTTERSFATHQAAWMPRADEGRAASIDKPVSGASRPGQGAPTGTPRAESRSAQTPPPANPEPEQTKVETVGGKSARTGGDERYRYVVVCADDGSGGPDDRQLTVTYGDEDSYEEASQDHCN